MKRRILSILTALALCLSLLSGTAWAEEMVEPEEIEETEEIAETAGEMEDKSGGWLVLLPEIMPDEKTVYKAGGGTITWEPVLENGVPVSGTVTLTNATITAANYGIVLTIPFTLVLEGSNTITTKVDGPITETGEHCGVLSRLNSLTITGPGSLTVNSAGRAIAAHTDLTVEGGAVVTVQSQGTEFGLTAQEGDLTIREGSTVHISMEGSQGSHNGVSANNGKLTIEDSHVFSECQNGAAIVGTEVILKNSDVAAIGNKPNSPEGTPNYTGVIHFSSSISNGFYMDGGTLYIKNSGGAYDFLYGASNATAVNSAVIYYGNKYYNLILSGDNIQYTMCTYHKSTDEITTEGNGFIWGNIVWNDNIIFGEKTSINGYNVALDKSYVAGNITIPDGVVATVPSGCGLYNYGTLTNNGTLVVEGTLQNVYQAVISGSSGSLINNGTMKVSASGSVMSTGTVTNNGTLNIEGSYSNFPTGKINGGTVNGLVIEYNASVSPKQFFYVANGDAKLLKNLPLALLSTQKQTMTIPSGNTLTIPEGIILDASQAQYGITNENLNECLSVDGNLVVNGTLRLPANTTQEQIEGLNLSGSGQIVIAGGPTYFAVTVTGGTANVAFAKAGDTVTLTAAPVSGKQFYGWEALSGVTITANEDGTYSFVMPSQSVTITAQYQYTVTFDSQGGSTVESQTVVDGETAVQPTAPERENCTFLSWYTDAAGTSAFDFSTPITDNLTLYAKWNVPVADVSVSQSTLSLNVGGTANLTVTFSPSDASNQSVTWESSNSAVATVDASGNVTAISAGTATITVTTADGGKTAACVVTVTEPVIPSIPVIHVTGVTLNKTSLALTVGGSEQLTARVAPSNADNQSVRWTSSNPAAATVDARGNVTAVSAGTATITVTTADGGKIASCSVTVEAQGGIIPPTEDDEIKFQFVTETGISAVPEGLKDNEALNTPEKLAAAMKTAIMVANTGISKENTAVYDVTLMVSVNGGAWTPATKENFPSGGLTVTLPYPDGTNSSYQFTVVHMFTTSGFGHEPGDTETPAVTNTADGIQFTVTGLSPISVGWVQPGASTIPAGSSGGGSVTVSAYPITVKTPEHGSVTSNRTNAAANSTVTLTVSPNSGYALNSLTVTDSRGNEIKLIAQSGSKYIFTMPGKPVTVKATFAPVSRDVDQTCDGGAACPSRSFTDLGSIGTWYHEAIDYVLRNGLMGGYGNGTFGPNNNLTRAQFSQILYNKEGKPAVTGSSIFADVKDSMWCAPAVTWAAANGIVGGYGNGLFRPNDNITREQLAVMLWRYAGSPAATDKELHFTDADKASGYTLDALRWAVENGILNGYGDGRINPKGLATRAQAAQMLRNYLEK